MLATQQLSAIAVRWAASSYAEQQNRNHMYLRLISVQVIDPRSSIPTVIGVKDQVD